MDNVKLYDVGSDCGLPPNTKYIVVWESFRSQDEFTIGYIRKDGDKWLALDGYHEGYRRFPTMEQAKKCVILEWDNLCE